MRDGLEDWDFWLTLIERGRHGRILPEFLFRYRRRRGSMSERMVRDRTYLGLYRRLIQKHTTSFRAHLPSVLREIEKETGGLLAHIHQLEEERHRWLEPALMSARDDVLVLEAKVAQARERREAEAERAQLMSERDGLINERDHVTGERDRVTAERDRLALELAQTNEVVSAVTLVHERARAEVTAIYQSRSWKVTRPLRAVYGWLLDLRDPRRRHD